MNPSGIDGVFSFAFTPIHAKEPIRGFRTHYDCCQMLEPTVCELNVSTPLCVYERFNQISFLNVCLIGTRDSVAD